MKTLALAALGLLVGAAGSSLASGCGCPDQALLAPGTYVPVAGAAAEPDYALTLSADRATVTESYTRNGKAYVTVYTTTPQP